MAAKIKQIRAREIFDSRGFGCSIYEALELRDGVKERLLGKGVQKAALLLFKAVANVNDIIAPKLIGMEVTKQTEIDKLMVESLASRVAAHNRHPPLQTFSPERDSVVKLQLLRCTVLDMLQVRAVSGEGLIEINLVSFLETLPAEMSPVRALKQHLHSIFGLSRFRQRLVFPNDDDVVPDDECALRPGEVQVVILSFCPASEAQVKALRDAARRGLTSKVETILHRPQDPDLGDPAPLFEASEHGQSEVARLLLEAKADKDKAIENGATPLYTAAARGHLKVARLLLEANADKDKATHEGTTPLFIAAQNGELAVARFLLEAKADKDKAIDGGATPLHIAAASGHFKVTRLLLEASADKDKADENGATPLFIAAAHGELAVARFLLAASADKEKAEQNGATPVHIAAQEGQLEVVRLLLEASADKDKAKANKATPLYVAAGLGELEVARFLLVASADKEKADQNGATPLHIAAQEGQLEVVRLLLEAKADKDKAMENGGATPLFVAAQTGQSEVVRLLLEANADKNKSVHDGTTPLFVATQAVSMAVCRAGAAASRMPLYKYIARSSTAAATLATDWLARPAPFCIIVNLMLIIYSGSQVYHNLKSVIKKKYGQDACNVGDEGGFAPSVQDNNEALDVLMEAIEKSGHAGKVKIGTDVAASEFYGAETKKYDLDFKNPESPDSMKKTAEEMIAYYKDWIGKYPFVSIEDPFDQDDWEAYSKFQAEVGETIQRLFGDSNIENCRISLLPLLLMRLLATRAMKP
ncbi:Enolase 2 [Symbiodinium microadriaticum]|uniref:phosphopyruvate hydratase n=1 Tax=Symbiodinium microadriaticum TaxID=2951 RepID=A0A1Q9F503_SYMMI|nr:Enolase 2 [Symbiodinium microadriaticum]